MASLQAALKKAKKDSRDQHVMQIMLKREDGYLILQLVLLIRSNT